jgi:hypothetical protein
VTHKKTGKNSLIFVSPYVPPKIKEFLAFFSLATKNNSTFGGFLLAAENDR